MSKFKQNGNGGIVMLVLLVGAGIGLIWLVLAAASAELEEWNQFKIDQNCVKVSYEKSHSSTGYGMMTNGKMGMVVTTTPSKTGWSCDDGVVYFR